MNNLHNRLLNSSSAYAKWHGHPHRSGHHMAIFIGVAVIVTLSVLSSIKSYALSYQDIAQAHTSTVSGSTDHGKSGSHLPDLTTNLLKAVKSYQLASEGNKPSALTNLVAVAQARKQAMLDQAETNP